MKTRASRLYSRLGETVDNCSLNSTEKLLTLSLSKPKQFELEYYTSRDVAVRRFYFVVNDISRNPE
ncbi:unnamed protein product, partial [Trichobilharzia szidati]